MPVYGCDQFSYDFDAALAAATAGRRATGGTRHPENCGPCGDCREALADYATIPAYAEQRSAELQEARDERAFWTALSIEAPTRAELLKHLEKFSRQQSTSLAADTRRAVEEVAAVYRIPLTDEPKSLEAVKRRASRRSASRPHEYSVENATMTGIAAR